MNASELTSNPKKAQQKHSKDISHLLCADGDKDGDHMKAFITLSFFFSFLSSILFLKK
jgi:hypothetical protein